MSRKTIPDVVLFDLDGTLLDSAPDMVAAANQVLRLHGQPETTLEHLRPHVSRGSRSMVNACFPGSDDTQLQQLVDEFLSAYDQVLGKHGQPFEGIETLLQNIEAAGSRWGIITNKPERFAIQLMPLLGWETRCSILLGGDTLAERKPHALPLLHAARQLDVAPDQCVYIGDDQRDVDAARAAGMPSIAALWGYRLQGDEPASWNADLMLETVDDLLALAHWP